jgi:hypothetical protein
MGPDALYSSPYFKVYTSLALAETGLAAEVAARGPARAIRCETAGTLQVKGASGATLESLAFKAGERQDVQAIQIEADTPSTGCVPITIYW